ncbi:hypothetical protein G6F35_016386 [Rhizopus arrhizus]|uniref:Uncharacterized protein n=1 Tax=Rhizopus delemar TaxID=936053 RepID=A0A9P7C1Q1_9FUNG|nr:hypothetical protein G6F35_016386 [Rhizopus arrhizus]KAG1531262.1 hypothetical protein G6F50_016798 [Rhizopus delemar]
MDGGPQALRVILAGQHLLRDLHEVRITQEEGAVAVGAAHRLHHQVGAVGRVHLLDVPAFEDLQHAGQRDATGRRRRRRGDLPAVVVEDDRFALLHPVSGQFLGGPLASGLLHAFQQQSAGLAPVEAVEATGGQAFQRLRQ